MKKFKGARDKDSRMSKKLRQDAANKLKNRTKYGSSSSSEERSEFRRRIHEEHEKELQEKEDILKGGIYRDENLASDSEDLSTQTSDETQFFIPNKEIKAAASESSIRSRTQSQSQSQSRSQSQGQGLGQNENQNSDQDSTQDTILLNAEEIRQKAKDQESKALVPLVEEDDDNMNDSKEDRGGRRYKKTKKSKREMKKEKKAKNKKKKKGILKRIILTILVLILLVIIAGVAAVVAIFQTDRWSITKEQLLSDSGAKIYDGNGELILELTGDEINKKVELSQMGHIPDAFVSIEDERFYEHGGVDIKRTTSAIINYILSGGKTSFGGSTITQQLVKITMKDDSRSGLAGIQRKIREWSRAVHVEEMLDKDQILQRYLNRIYLGNAGSLEVRGVEAASNYYFNKTANETSIAEAAFIAGINHAPGSYYPFSESEEDKEDIKNRTLTVLTKMHELGKITDDEYTQAKEEVNNGLNFQKGDVSNGNSELSYHAAAAINQIANELSDAEDIEYSEARDLVVSSGYSIYTTVNQTAQKSMEKIFYTNTYIINGTNPKDSSADRSGQSAMVVVDPKTGHVIAECGGLGENQNALGLNRALTARQGGSAFKPLVTVAPGLENNIITPATLFYDVKTSFGSYSPGNAEGSYHGIENMRSILTHSCNVPEVKLLSILGTDKSAEFLGKIGIEVDPDFTGLSMALGSVDVSPLQMAAAYAMILNGGEYITPTFYTKVEDRDGKVVIEAAQEKNRVMSEVNAYLEISMLTGPVKSGTASGYANFLGNMAVAGKTGSTDTYQDRWFCGMTPYYAAACWYGNDQNNGKFAGSNQAAKIWFNTMKTIIADMNLENKSFTKPDGIVTRTVCKQTGHLATEACTNTYSEIFSKDNLPKTCEGHKGVEVCKETGKLATDNCPEKVTRYYGYTIDTEKNAKWSPTARTASAPTETCDVHKETSLTIPNVVGLSEADATSKLKAAGFEVESKKSSDKTGKTKKGYVMSQSQTGTATKGTKITIVVNQYEGGTTTTTNTTPTTTNTTTTPTTPSTPSTPSTSSTETATNTASETTTEPVETPTTPEPVTNETAAGGDDTEG